MRRSLVSLGLAALTVLIWPATALAATDPNLGSAGNFAVLSGAGHDQYRPQLDHRRDRGFRRGHHWIPPGTAGPKYSGGSVYTTAETDLVGAFTRATQSVTTDYSNINLGGKTLGPGVYNQSTAPTLTGTLTLNGGGVYIFQIGSTLVTASGARVALIGGAQPCDIFWRVNSSATSARQRHSKAT